MTDNHTLHGFASPAFAFDLHRAGFNPTTTFFWQRVSDSDVRLNSYAFDPDKYYQDADRFFFETKLTSAKRFPAFGIRDMELYLPDFCLCRVNNQYELSIDSMYNIAEVRAERLPDVFAKMLLSAIEKNIVDTKIFNRYEVQ